MGGGVGRLRCLGSGRRGRRRGRGGWGRRGEARGIGEARLEGVFSFQKSFVHLRSGDTFIPSTACSDTYGRNVFVCLAQSDSHVRSIKAKQRCIKPLDAGTTIFLSSPTRAHHTETPLTHTGNPQSAQPSPSPMDQIEHATGIPRSAPLTLHVLESTSPGTMTLPVA